MKKSDYQRFYDLLLKDHQYAIENLQTQKKRVKEAEERLHEVERALRDCRKMLDDFGVQNEK